MILIVGDSWPAGVWINDQDDPLNLGLGHALVQQGHRVINLAKPGGSNLESVDRLRDFLRCNQNLIPEIKTVLFWQTEFFREIWYYRHSNIWPPLDKELARGYRKMRDQWVYRPYYRLAELSQQWGVQIKVIGGASDTVWYDEFEKDFPGVEIVCQSITNLLIYGNHRIADPVFCGFSPTWIEEGNFLNLVKKNISLNDLESLVADMEKGEQRHALLEDNPDLFGPDLVHPNEKAHGLILDFLQRNNAI